MPCFDKHECPLKDLIKSMDTLPTLMDSREEYQAMLQKDIDDGAGWDK